MFCSLAAVFFFGLETRVHDLIEQMDNPNFRVREEAVKKVACYGRFSAAALKESSKEHRSKEVRNGCKKALEIVYRSDFYTVHPSWFPKFKKYPRLELVLQLTGSPLVSRQESQENLQWLGERLPNPRVNGMRDLPTWSDYLHRAESQYQGKKDVPRLEYQRFATQLYVRDLLDVGMPRDDVLLFVNKLTEIERRCHLKYDFLPPELKEPPVKK